jgi:hypothetical protein
MNHIHYDYQDIALKKLYTSLVLERIDWGMRKQGNNVTEPNGSEDRKKNRMKEENKQDTRDATNRDKKRNPADFDPGKKAAAENNNDDSELHTKESKRALNVARNDLVDVLNFTPPSDEEQARKGNAETRANRERMDRNQNLPLKDLKREGESPVPVTTRTITRKDGIIDAIDEQLKKRKGKRDTKESQIFGI